MIIRNLAVIDVIAQMAELVDALASGASTHRCASSSLVLGKFFFNLLHTVFSRRPIYEQDRYEEAAFS